MIGKRTKVVLLPYIIEHIGNLCPLGSMYMAVYLEDDGWEFVPEPVGNFDRGAVRVD